MTDTFVQAGYRGEDMSIGGYIIEKYNNMTGAYTCNRLLDEGRKLGMELDLVGVYDTYATRDGVYNMRAPQNGVQDGYVPGESVYSIKNMTPADSAEEDNGEGTCAVNRRRDAKKLEKRDFCVWRYKPGSVKGAVASLADRSYNRADAFEKYVSKYAQMRDISSDAFAKPAYMLARADIPYEAVASVLGERFVAKGLFGSMGREVFLVNCKEDYLNLEYGNEWLFEEYIEESAGRDLRIYAVRGEAVACMERRSTGDFRANVALGASVSSHPITAEIKRAANDVYKCTGLDFAGIDLLFGRDGLYFCEVNVTPGIEGIEHASGKNIAGIVMSTIWDDLLAGKA